jgi:very-short-patch-repair endonuclease
MLRRMKSGLDDLLRNQFGVISRRQALALGMSPAAVQTRLTRRDWWPVHTGVYLVRSHPQSPGGEIWAAVLAIPGSVVSAATAAWWWGLTDRRPGHVDLIVPPQQRPRPKRGVEVVRRTLQQVDITRHRGLPVTAKPLSTLTAAVALGRRGPAMLDRALQRSVRFEDVRDAHYRYLGCHGSARAGELLRAAADHAAAESERLLIRLLRSAGVGGFAVNQPQALPDGGVCIPDFTFTAHRVIVEVDGWAWHHDPQRFARDRRNQNALQLLGWTVLRFTWFDLVDRPQKVLADIRSALAGRQEHPGLSLRLP